MPGDCSSSTPKGSRTTSSSSGCGSASTSSESSRRWTPARARELLRPERPAEIRLGLERVVEVCRRLGHPEQQIPSLLVAGTNGKGSTCAFLDAILRRAGYRTGLYTSPHLLDWPERIRVQGRCISWDELAGRIGEVEQAAPDIPLTPFERLTIAAFLHFASAGPDLLVLEVGLGGRLDATRVVTPCLSVVTAIGLDHQAFLGSTIGEIAREKAGIFEPGVPAVTSARGEALTVLREVAGARGVPLTEVGAGLPGRVVAAGRTVDSLIPGLAGEHQQENMRLAVTGLLLLEAAGRVVLPDADLRRGVQEVCWPGRLQVLPGLPPTLLDGAHNPHGATALARYLASLSPAPPVHLLFGILEDKDVAGTLAPLLPGIATLTLVRPSGPRGLDPARLLPLAARVPARVSPLAPGAALAELRGRVPPESLVVAAGSLHLIGELLGSLASEGVGAGFWSVDPGS